MPAQLPAQFRAKPTRLGDMQVGDILIFQPSAMLVDKNRQCWLDPNAMGTATYLFGGWLSHLRVERRADGYVVSIRVGFGGLPSWDITTPPLGLGAPIPVVEFIEETGAPEKQEAPDGQ